MQEGFGRGIQVCLCLGLMIVSIFLRARGRHIANDLAYYRSNNHIGSSLLCISRLARGLQDVPWAPKTTNVGRPGRFRKYLGPKAYHTRVCVKVFT
jgi:hypothetical protein